MATKWEVEVSLDDKSAQKKLKEMRKNLKQTEDIAYKLTRSLQFEYSNKKFLQAQQATQKALTLTQDKIKNIKKQLEVTDKDTPKFTSLQNSLARSQIEVEKLEHNLKKLDDIKLDQVGKGLRDMGSKLTNLGNSLKGVSVIAGTFLATMTAISKSTITYGDTLGTTAKQLNLTTKQLQQWQFIADQTDVSQSNLTNGLTKMQAALSDFAGGEVNESAKAIQELGISTEQAKKGMSVNIDDIVDKLSNLTSETDQARLANDIFGTRLGAKFLPLLKSGGDGLKDIASQFEDFGYMSDDTVSKLDAFEDELDRIKYQATVIKNIIGGALYPVFKQLGDFVSEKALPFFKQLAEKFDKLSPTIKKIIVGVTAAVTALAPLLLVGGKLLTGVGSLMKSVMGLGKALGVLATNPVVAIIALAVAGFIALYNSSEKFKKSINNLFKAMKPLFNVFVDLFSQLLPLLSQVATPLKAVFEEIGDALGDLLIAITPIINDLVQTLVPIIKDLIKQAMPIIKEILQPLISFMASAYVGIAKLQSTIIKFIATTIKNVYKFFKNINSYASIFKNSLVKGVNSVIDWIGDRINNVIDFINTLIDKLNTVLKLANKELPKINNVDISGNLKAPEIVAPTFAGTATTANSALSQGTTAVQSAEKQTITNNTSNVDNSTKSVTIQNVNITAVDGQVDIDDFINKVNERLGGLVG